MLSDKEGRHFGDSVFSSRCYSWGFWSHFFDIRGEQADAIMQQIADKPAPHERQWSGHKFREHRRNTKDGKLVKVQPRTLVTLPNTSTYAKKRYQVSDRTVLYFLEYGVVRDLVPTCGEKHCIAPEHQTEIGYTTINSEKQK